MYSELFRWNTAMGMYRRFYIFEKDLQEKNV